MRRTVGICDRCVVLLMSCRIRPKIQMADVGPSAQSVGREFVRQYYTMLNERPDCLHRFVNFDKTVYCSATIETSCRPGAHARPQALRLLSN